LSVTSAANTLILNAVIAQSINNIDVISVQDASGEYVRKEPQSVEEISSTKKKFTFYFNETEANTDIIKMSLFGNSATTTIGDGTEMAEQTVDIQKTNTQSLLIYWTVEVV